MQFTSTRNNKLSVPFSKAVSSCLPDDGGVFVPASSSIEDLRRWIYYIDENTTFNSIAGTLSSAFLKEEFSPIICETIATTAFPFEPKVTQLDENLFNMELFHGYSGCHKDFGVSYLCSYLETTHELQGGNTIFVDYTNGGLGSLLAKVLRGKKHIKSVLIYKKGTVRGLLESDYVWNGGNILPVEMEGSEEDIKAKIGQLFEDKAFVQKMNISVANTTNVCRLMAQMFYFPYAFAQIKHKVDSDIYYACDAGNYATLVAGLYSWRFALPLNGIYLPSTQALSTNLLGEPLVLDSFVDFNHRGGSNPIMPANLERLESFFDHNKLMMRNFVFPSDVTERSREKAAKELFIKYKVFADPGTAAAYAVVKENAAEVFDEGGAVVLISQNHPSLSSDYCRHIVGETPEMPDYIKETFVPVEINRAVVKSCEELKGLIQGLL
ncbi:MAG: threonine synthase [Treponema sp.]|nr:threonine synthase [Treponema sp.]